MSINQFLSIILYIVLTTVSITYIYIFNSHVNDENKAIITLASFIIFAIYIFYIGYLILTDKSKNWYSYISYFISGIFVALLTYSISKIFNIYENENNKNYMFSIAKHLGILLCGVAVVFGIIWLSSISKFLAIVFSVLMLVVCLGSMGYLFYKYNKYLNKDNNGNKLNFITRIIIAVLTSKTYFKFKEFINFFINSIKTARYEVLIILLVQIVLIIGYLLIPSIKSIIFNDINSTKIKELKKKKSLREKTIDSNIKQLEREIKELKEFPNFSEDLWNDIFEKEIYKLDKGSIDDEDDKESVTSYLLDNDYQTFISNETTNIKKTTDVEKKKHAQLEQKKTMRDYITFKRLRNFYNIIFQKRMMTLEEATEYIIANSPVILDKEAKIKKLQANKRTTQLKNAHKDNLIKVVLKNPVYTNNKRTMEMKNIDLGANNYNYSISCWFFIHDTPANAKITSNKFMTLLNYNNKPKIEFNTNLNKLKLTYNVIDPSANYDTLRTANLCDRHDGKNLSYKNCTCGTGSNKDCSTFLPSMTCSNKSNCMKCEQWKKTCEHIDKLNLKEKKIEIYSTKNIKLQKWNNLVINYNSGTLDIFINGKMVNTITEILSNQNNGMITIGDDDGVDGGIASIVYFPNPLNITQIKTFYNLLKNKSPPVI